MGSRVAEIMMLLPFLLWGPQASAGQALSEAQAQQAKAFNDYYRAYRASKSKSPEDVSKLTQKFLAPASDSVTRAMAQESYSAVQKSGVLVGTQEQAELARARLQKDREQAASAGGGRKPGSASSTASLAASGGGAPLPRANGPLDSAPMAPEPVIDGAKVPKEITFKK